ncbi:MAG: hypothetical protein IPM17_18735 [Verrucomicrobia bacterium]|nr:hypothetical protein [Verrucomicrobiota bacterium]
MNPSRWPRLIRWLKRFVFALAVLVTLTALALAIEGYRAKRAWTAWQAELTAKGEPLDWQSVAPTLVPNEQNFLATPLLARCFGFETNPPSRSGDTNDCSAVSQLLPWAGTLPSPGDWRTGTITPLATWQAALRGATKPAGDQADRRLAERYGPDAKHIPPDPPAAEPIHPDLLALQARPPGTAVEDLRFLLERHRATFEELRAAARRPQAQLNLGPQRTSTEVVEHLLPGLARLKGLLYPLRTSAWTELNARNPDAALRDVETMLRVSDAATSQPLLIVGLVRVAMMDLTVQTIWAGLAEHLWQEPQLAALEKRLAEINIVADLQRCLRGERVFAVALIGQVPTRSPADPFVADDPLRLAMRWWPTAVRYRNQINLARAYQTLLIERFDPANRWVRVIPTAPDLADRAALTAWSPYNLFTRMLLPAVEKSLEKAAASQAAVSLARVACALERHRLAAGHYPESLDALTSRFLDRLPPDPVTGQPLKYRRDAPERFVLYSVGLDGKDDGGQAMTTGKEARGVPVQTGDWVWRSHPDADDSPAPAGALQ